MRIWSNANLTVCLVLKITISWFSITVLEYFRNQKNKFLDLLWHREANRSPFYTWSKKKNVKWWIYSALVGYAGLRRDPSITRGGLDADQWCVRLSMRSPTVYGKKICSGASAFNDHGWSVSLPRLYKDELWEDLLDYQFNVLRPTFKSAYSVTLTFSEWKTREKTISIDHSVFIGKCMTVL
jgi:hypothetical protein